MLTAPNANLELSTFTTTMVENDSETVIPEVVDIFPSLLDGIITLPYRVLFLITLAIWLWAFNLKICSIYKVDLSAALNFQDDSSSYMTYESGRSIAIISSSAVLISYFLFLASGSQPSEGLSISGDILPFVTLFIIIFILLNPGVNHKNHGRRHLLSSLKRAIVGNIDVEHRTADIVLSDTVTSYAKVLTDLAIFLCQLFSGVSSVKSVDRSCGSTCFLVPLISVIPPAIRFRQCLIEYRRSGRRNKTHALNSIKYFTNFPLILSVYLISIAPTEEKSYYYKLWALCSFVNSTYSFIWDVVCDWELLLLHYILYPSSLKHNYDGLRSVLHFPSKNIYYGAIVIDFFLRYFWVTRFLPLNIEIEKYSNVFNAADSISRGSSFWFLLANLYNFEMGNFIIEIVEIFRRWIWIFFRLEAEWVRIQNSILETEKIYPEV